jgi:putative aldouronate transport system permease protein
MAVVIVTMFPIMAIYPFFQKYFTKGMFVGSIKG